MVGLDEAAKYPTVVVAVAEDQVINIRNVELVLENLLNLAPLLIAVLFFLVRFSHWHDFIS